MNWEPDVQYWDQDAMSVPASLKHKENFSESQACLLAMRPQVSLDWCVWASIAVDVQPGLSGLASVAPEDRRRQRG